MNKRNQTLINAWIVSVAILCLTPACNFLGLAGGDSPGAEAFAPVDSGKEIDDRGFFLGHDLKDDQSCLVAGVVQKKQIISSAFLHSETIQFTMIDEDGESVETVLPLDQDFSVYRFHSQLKSHLESLSIPEGSMARLSVDISAARATVQGEILEIYLPGRKIELEFQPPLAAGTPIPAALCLAERLELSEGGVSLSPALFQFRSLGSSLAGVVGLSVESQPSGE